MTNNRTALERYLAARNISGNVTKRFTTGFPKVDRIFEQDGTCGLAAGIYTIAGDPGTGKSSFVLQVMERMEVEGHMCSFFAFEGKDNIRSIMRRMGMGQGHRNFLPALFDETDGYKKTHESICDYIRDLANLNTSALPIVIGIDSLKHVNAHDRTNGQRKAMQAFHELNDELRQQGKGFILFLIAHVDKASRGRGKANKKLQGAAEIEELADAPMFFLDRTPDSERGTGIRRIVINLEKNRFGAPGEYDGFYLTQTGFKFAKVK